MDEEQIDFHLSEADRINENATEPQSNRVNMEGDESWYEVEDVLETRKNPNGTYSYLIKWKDYAEKAWTHETNTSTEAIETWNLKTSREGILKIRLQKQFKCSIPVDTMSKTERSMSTGTPKDPLKKEEIVTHPPGDVEYVETEDDEENEKTNVNRTRKRTRNQIKSDQSSSSSGSSSSDSLSDSSSNSDSGNEGKKKKK